MKTITKIITAVTGVVASLFTMACERQAPRVYGPPPAEAINRQPAQDVQVPDLPQTNDDAVGDIYGPPSMLTGNPDDDDPIDEDNDADMTGAQDVMPEPELPAPIYGVAPEIPSIPPAPQNNASGDVDDNTDETIKEYKKATKPKPPVTKYGIRPTNIVPI